MSQLEVDKIIPQSGTTLTLGDTGDTINFGSGVLPNFENLTVTGDLTVDTNSLKVDSANNRVGIGTASPSVALDVVGAITASGNITGTLATAAQPNITSVGTLTSFASTGIDDNATSTAITINSSESVGIGTTSHTNKLTVNGSSRVTGEFLVTDGNVTDGSGTSKISMDVDAGGNSLARIRTSSNGGGNIHSLAFFTGVSEVMRYNSSANLGIGTSSPTSKLTVSDANTAFIHVEENTGDSGDTAGILFKTSASDGFFKSGMILEDDGTTYARGKLHIVQNSAANNSNATVSDARITVLNNGNVGIGTTSPSEQLEIAGTGTQTLKIDRTDASTAGAITINSANDSNYIYNLTSKNLIFGTNNNARMTIDGSGNVGINTSSPSEKLTVETTTGISIKGPGSGDGIIKLVSYAGSQNAEAQIKSARGNTSGTDSRLKFYTNNGTSTLERIDINDNGDISFYEDTGTTAKLFWDASEERLGIGTTSPSYELQVQDTGGSCFIAITSNNTNESTLLLGDSDSASIGRVTYRNSDNSLAFNTNGSEAMRIDSNGNLMVGKTSVDTSTSGVEFRSDGLVGASRASNPPLLLNRRTDDGNVVLIRKDNSNVGFIGVKSSKVFFASNTANNTGIKINPDAITPSTYQGVDRDNAIDLGASSSRYKDLYLGGGLYVGGTGSANKLDDYEEGTWTGTISDGTNNATMGSNTGAYVKIGSLVVLTGYFTVTSLGSVSGNLRLTGLPFACGSSNSFYTSNGLGWGANLNITDDTTIGFQIDTNASHLNFTHWDNTSGTTLLQASQLTASGQFMMNLSYRTDA